MKPALLVIDVQNEYFAPDGAWVLPEGEAALQRIQGLLAAARDAQIPIFHILHEGLSAHAPVFRPGSRGVEQHPAIEVRPGERRITKHFPSSFAQTPLEAYLRLAGVDTIIISGYMTHLCCDTTARAARERDLAVLFAADATATRDLTLAGATVPHQTVHQTTLAVMTHFASVLSSAEIAGRLRDHQTQQSARA